MVVTLAANSARGKRGLCTIRYIVLVKHLINLDNELYLDNIQYNIGVQLCEWLTFPKPEIS